MTGYVQRVHAATSSGASTVITLAVNTTALNTLVAAFKTAGSFAVTAVSDSKGNTWQIDKVTTTSSAARLNICSAYLTTALVIGDTITFTVSGSSASSAVAVYEYNGIAATSWVDGSAIGNQGNGATSGATGNYTSGHAADLIFTAGATGSGTAWTAPTSPWTERASGLLGVDAADQTVASTGTFNPTWAWTTSSNFGVVVVGYKYAAVPGTGLKYWNGSAWVSKPVKAYVGGSWTSKPLKRWNGSTWITV